MKYLIVSNGCGAGHAVRDLTLAEQIRKEAVKRKCSDLQIIFASYGAGPRFFRAAGEDMIDLKQPERPDISELMKELNRVILLVRPDILISDEVVTALRVSGKYKIPTFYLTNHLMWGEHSVLRWMCKGIVYAELSERLPVMLRKKHDVKIVGPIVRERFSENLQPDEELNMPPVDVSCRMIHVWLGGSCDKAAQLENIWLLNQVFNQLEGYEIYVHGDEYERFFQKRITSGIHWVKRSSTKPYREGIQISRGGIQTLWEIALSGGLGISVPYSGKVNPLENTYSEYMEKRGLSSKVTYQDLRDEKLRMLVEGLSRQKSEGADKNIQSKGQMLIRETREAWNTWMDELM
ncbi:MAG: hypothetical protein HUJ69_04670 [Lachnospiraceae bacterium]|nr:hypothetical protein [Lachnospiraceae bacterium]